MGLNQKIDFFPNRILGFSQTCKRRNKLKDEGLEKFLMHKLWFWLSLLLLIFMSTTALADWSLVNMPPGVTIISRDVYHLHMMIFWIAVAIGVGVFGVMFYAIFKHRKSKGHVAAQFHEHTLVEVLWAVIPLIILIVMAIPASKVLIQMNEATDSEVNIKVTGYQWKWKYDYLDDGISFFSSLATPIEQIQNEQSKNKNYLLEVDHPLVVPTDTKIRFLVTANDVIHSWWVPELGIKKDGIPGYIREAWAVIDHPGTYRGQCAELCGTNHGYMPIVVIAKTREDYAAWLAQQKSGRSSSDKSSVLSNQSTQANLSASKVPTTLDRTKLMAEGEKIYKTVCSACHQANGEGIVGVFKAIKGSPVVNGPLNIHIKTILFGVKGTAMQSFAGQLSDEEIASVITYQRNSFGNHMGDAAQPNDIKKIRQNGGS